MAYRLVIFGAPGAGKGTQSERLVKEFGISHISTGDMFRQAISEKTPLGRLAQTFIHIGKLVPDEIVIDMVKERLRKDDCKDGFLLDGFPRTQIQAKMLTSMLEQMDAPLSAVIDLEVPREVLQKRLAGRRVCPTCNTNYLVEVLGPSELCPKDFTKVIRRNDDYEKAVEVRLDLFDSQTEQLRSYYQNKEILVKINGNQVPEVVFDEIKKKLEKK